METTQSAHPNSRQLAALALGKLAPEARDRLQAHVTNCAACREYITKTPRETLVALLQSTATAQPAAEQSTPAAQQNRSTLAKPPLVRATSMGAPSASRSPKPVPPPADILADDSIPKELREQTKYRIVRLLGRGGMGSVYEVHHLRMDRRAALKVINPELVDNDQALARFDEEIRAVAKLDHPNIARAFDAENFGALQAIVMEFVPGQTLHDFLKKRGRLSVMEACRCVRQACLGLQHAHEQGLVHRDIKPHNLMVTQDKGIVKILDFGLAKVVSENNRGRGLTRSNMTMGTYEYCAPEQALDAASADIRADIYSLGCTLYYLIAGQLPFSYQSDAKLLMAHQNETPRPLCEVRPEVPQELSDLIARMLAKKPADRPQTPAEVAKALLPFAKGEFAPPPAERPFAAVPPTAVAPGLDNLFDDIQQGGILAGYQSKKRTLPPKRAAHSFLDWLRKSPRNMLIATVGAIGTLGLICFGVVISIQTSAGTVKIELSDPQAQVEVKVDGDVIDIAGLKEPIRLKAGEHGLTVTSGDYQSVSQSFVVHSGKEEVVRVTLEPLPIKVVEPAPLPKAPAPKLVAAADVPSARADPFGPAEPPAVKPAPPSRPAREITNSMGATLIYCPAGSFTMGSGTDETGRSDDENQVSVTISKGFYLGKYSVTQSQFKSVMGTTPWSGKPYVKEGDDYPATYVDWNDAVEFCKRLTASENAAGRLPQGYVYALPTEAQREYAARAGTSTAYSYGDDPSVLGNYAWYDKNAYDVVGEKYAHQVGQKKPNRWGFYDLHGNVYEWCRDYYTKTLPGGTDPFVDTGSYRVFRGGGWNSYARSCRSACRYYNSPENRNRYLGFRVALVPADK